MATRRLSRKTLQAIQRYGPSVADVAQQYGISGEALLAKLVVGESGDNAKAVSPAGAKGRTQFMPGSRDIAVQKYGVDPWRSPDEAVHAAALHLQGKINGSKGLEGYNPGDPNYPSYILGQQVGNVRGSGGSSSPGTTTTTSRVLKTPAVDRGSERRAAIGTFLGQGGVGNSAAVLNLAQTYGQLKDTPATYGTKTVTSGGSGSTSSGGSASGSFKVTGPNPGRLQPSLVSFAEKVAGVYGGPLSGSDGTGHSRLTVNGRVSQHSTGNATDIPATGKRLLKIGRAALIAAGMSPAEARKAKGGLYNVGGHQVIFATNEGGNHFDHVHVSAR